MMESGAVKHRVVVARNGKIYRAELSDTEVERKGNQIVLPKDMYSAGFVERVWSIEWDSLEWLPPS